MLSLCVLFSDLGSLDRKFVYCGEHTVEILQFAWTRDELFPCADFVCNKQGVQFEIYYVFTIVCQTVYIGTNVCN